MTKDYPTEKKRCSICGCWMKEFDTSFYVEGYGTIPHALRMCVNPKCPDSISKDFVPPVPRKSDSLRIDDK